MKKLAIYILVIFWLASFSFAQSVDFIDNAAAKKTLDREAAEVKQTQIDWVAKATKTFTANAKSNTKTTVKKVTKKTTKKTIKKVKKK